MPATSINLENEDGHCESKHRVGRDGRGSMADNRGFGSLPGWLPYIPSSKLEDGAGFGDLKILPADTSSSVSSAMIRLGTATVTLSWRPLPGGELHLNASSEGDRRRVAMPH
jgi:hypothetical protein